MRQWLLVFAVAIAIFPPRGMAQDDVEIFVQKGHSGLVQSIAISKDGKFALSGGSEKKLIYWRMRDGKEVRSWDRHTGSVDAVAISPDGKIGLSASNDNTIKVWNLMTGNEIRTLPGFASAQSIVFSPDGEHVLIGDAGGSLTLLFVPNWRPTFKFKVQSGSVGTVAYSPNGKLVLSGHSDASIKLWDAETGDLVRTFVGHKGRVASLAFSPDGKHIISGSADKTLRLWDVETGNAIGNWVAHDAQVTSVAFSPDGKQIASASLANTIIKIWDANTGKEVRSLDEKNARVYSIAGRNFVHTLAYSPDGKTILAGSLASIKLWNVATGEKVGALSGAASANSSLAISPDGTQVLNGEWSITEKPGFNLWSLTTGKGIRGFRGHDNPVNSVSFSSDGLRILTASDDKTLKIWDLNTGAEITNFAGHAGAVLNAAFSPDGKKIVSSAAQKGVGAVKLWDVASGKEILNITGDYLDPSPFPVAFVPDGTQAVTASQFMQDFADESGRVKDLSGNDLTSQYRRHSLNLIDVSSGRSSNTFYASRSVSGYVFDVKTGAFGKVISVAVSPDGQLALTGSLPGNFGVKDDNIRLWNVKSGKEVRGFAGHRGRVSSVAFSPDGLTAVSGEGYQYGQSDLLIKLWDVATGKQLGAFSGHTDDIFSVAFSKNGRQIISASSDNTSRVWDVASGKEIVQHIHFNNDEWISITPSGYFSASSVKVSENVNIRIGMEVYGIDQFYDVFYRPDVVEAALGGKDISSMVVFSMREAVKNAPPVVERVVVPSPSSANAVRVAYSIRSVGGGIGDVRVFHNGKLVKSDGVSRNMPDSLLGKSVKQITGDEIVSQMRNLVVQAVADTPLVGAVLTPTKNPDFIELSVDIEPIPGENDISVVAFNAQNSIQSVAGTATFTSKKSPVAPRLHILAVGIDEYKDKSVTLNFAAKDSRDIAARWKAQAVSIYGMQNIFVETISNAQASRAGILAKINGIAARAKSTDHFFLFVAGHGVLMGDQYYMVTSDYDGTLMPSKLISANEIIDFSKRIKALSQLYILDTCHAGGMGGVVSGLYDARVSVLAKRMGLHIFASASSTEEALDGFEGNGLFTHTLLQGLNNNKKADSNLDNQISLMELGGYSKERTKEIAKEVKHKQDPLIINFGQDTAIYRLQ